MFVARASWFAAFQVCNMTSAAAESKGLSVTSPAVEQAATFLVLSSQRLHKDVFDQLSRGFKEGCLSASVMMRAWFKYLEDGKEPKKSKDTVVGAGTGDTATATTTSTTTTMTDDESRRRQQLAMRVTVLQHSDAHKRTRACANEVVVFLAAHAAICVLDETYVPPRIRLIVEHEDAQDTFALAAGTAYRGMNVPTNRVDKAFAMCLFSRGLDEIGLRCAGSNDARQGRGLAECLVQTYKHKFDTDKDDVQANDLFVFLCSTVPEDKIEVPARCHGWMAVGTPTGVWLHELS